MYINDTNTKKSFLTSNFHLDKSSGLSALLGRKFAVVTFPPSIFSWIYHHHIFPQTLIKIILTHWDTQDPRVTKTGVIVFWPHFTQFIIFDLAGHCLFLETLLSFILATTLFPLIYKHLLLNVSYLPNIYIWMALGLFPWNYLFSSEELIQTYDSKCHLYSSASYIHFPIWYLHLKV